MKNLPKLSKNLLSIDTNPKTIKGQKYGFMTGVLYLSPASLSGVNLCPMAELAGCIEGCLNSAGRGAFNATQQARLNKTLNYLHNTEAFMARLADNVRQLVNKASKAGLVPLVRLNGTTDIRWENVPVSINGKSYRNIMAAFPAVQFYDYTKIANRKGIPANYDLTYSYSGRADYLPFVEKAKAAGMRIAVVFRKREDIPSEFMGMECVDGDDSDIRHIDPQGVVVALYAKGKAKRDASGFVVDAGKRVIPILSA